MLNRTFLVDAFIGVADFPFPQSLPESRASLPTAPPALRGLAGATSEAPRTAPGRRTVPRSGSGLIG
jgi:hypothetical protein